MNIYLYRILVVVVVVVVFLCTMYKCVVVSVGFYF